MTNSRHRRLERRKRRIQDRLRQRHGPAQEQPMFRASNIHYEVADRTQAVGVGGIGAIHRMARQSAYYLETHPTNRSPDVDCHLAGRSSSARITDRQGVPLSGSDAPIFRERAHQPRAAGLIVDCHRASKVGYAACLE